MADVWNTSVSGIKWRTCYKYTESFGRDANVSTVWIECKFDEGAQLKDDLLGSATYVGGGKLTRVTPYPSGYYAKQYAKRFDLDLFYPNSPDAACVYPDPAYDNFLGIDGRIQYKVEFGNFPYTILKDTELDLRSDTLLNCPAELQRFCRVSRRYLPEAQKVPSAGFECYDPSGTPAFPPFVIQEVGFIPTYQIEIVVECVGWPIQNYPAAGVAECIGKVNSGDVRIGVRGTTDDAGTYKVFGGIKYSEGQLLYKGLASELVEYDGPDQKKYCDPAHIFGFRPNGWNKYRRNDGTYYPIRVKGSTDTPMFKSEDLTRVFRPEPEPVY